MSENISVRNRHDDRMRFRDPGEAVQISVVNSNDSEYILDHT